MLYGGIPLVVLRDDMLEKAAFLENLFSEIYITDIYKRNKIRPFRKIDDSFKKIVITKDLVPVHYDEHGILTLNIYDFLLNPRSIVEL